VEAGEGLLLEAVARKGRRRRTTRRRRRMHAYRRWHLQEGRVAREL
jgi:hypothetical protein